MSETFQGELEIDRDRGVIYFHVADEAVAAKIGSVTMLRICRLPKPIPDNQMLDITTGHGHNWKGREIIRV